MDTQKAQVVDWLKSANNVLVTVSANPSVDQLSAAIGLTLLLNKMGKHATAVFSGQTPSTIEFLQPEKTLEKNTDSLRDFIIALDKSKADKLRYKVEDQMVKIFITPYRTSLSDKDLEFSQGDFNVDVVMALGVKEQTDLDKAIIAHGRILHDAKVVGVSNNPAQQLGNVNLIDTRASSLCEILAALGVSLQPDILDAQIATAFLTGIVAETDRFSNQKTSSETMQMSSKLMTAGANQQLVAKQLKPTEEKVELLKEVPDKKIDSKDDKGALEIEHNEPAPKETVTELPEPQPEPPEIEQIHISEDGQIEPPAPEDKTTEKSRFILEPPTLGGRLTANSEPEALDPSTDPLGAKTKETPILTHTEKGENKTNNPPKTEPAKPQPSKTLTQLEKETDSPHLDQPATNDNKADLDSARQAVEAAAPPTIKPPESLGSQYIDIDPKPTPANPSPPPTPTENVTSDPGLPPGLSPNRPDLPPPSPFGTSSPSVVPPPPVPPPMMPPPVNPSMSSGQQPLPNAENDNDAQEPPVAL